MRKGLTLVRRLIGSIFLALAPVVAAVAGEDPQQIICSLPQMTEVSILDGGVSNDVLFRHYLEQRIVASLPGYVVPEGKAVTRSGRDALTGNDARVYEALVPYIREIAAGTRRSSVITIPAEQITDCGPYKASQLGIDAVVANQAITSEAAAKANEIASFDLGTVIRALLADMPYELYWFWKSSIPGPSMPSYGAQYIDGEYQLTVSGNYVFRLYVAKAYSATNSEQTTDLCERPAKVATAIDRAQQIVADHASESPIEKLYSYRDEIMALVEYDTPASLPENNTPYGDPWQLISAFDGDGETKIVCEGYAKAFKYLCDLSGFADIECLLVSGDMFSSNSDQPATGQGAHMWNVVRMDNGLNYLVDVTNSEEGSAGSDGELFMAYNPSGDYENGYRVRISDNYYINYIYDEGCKQSFGEQALTLSDLPYEAPARKVSLTEDGDIASQIGSLAGQSGVRVNYRRTGLTTGQACTVCLPFAYPLPMTNIGTFYTFKGVTVNESTGEWEALFTEDVASTLEANKPYLFVTDCDAVGTDQPVVPASMNVDFSGEYTLPSTINAGSKTVGKWTLKGMYASKTWSAGDAAADYGFTAFKDRDSNGNIISAGTFVRCGAGASIAPLRCYLTYSGTAGTRGETLPDCIGVRFVSRGDDGGTTGISDLPARMTGIGDWFDLSGRRIGGKPAAKGIYIHNGRKTVIK